MAEYTDTEKAVLYSTPLQDILEYFGKDTSHTRSFMYHSPFEEDRNPSFHITPSKNIWFDFSSGKGGNGLDLVVLLANCNRGEALDILAKMQRNFVPSSELKAPLKKIRKDSGNRIIIDKAYTQIRNKALQSYLLERGISLQTADLWCYELIYHIGNDRCRQFFGIGFRNDEDGFVIRSSKSKRCTSCKLSSISCDDGGDQSTVAVFEGFMDFLSWFEDNGFEELPCDACVLNSVVNVRHAIGWLQEHTTVDLYLDNDAAGRKASDEIRNCCTVNGSTSVNDQSSLYSGFKDYNEMLLDRRKNSCSTSNTVDRNGRNTFKGRPGTSGQNQLG